MAAPFCERRFMQRVGGMAVDLLGELLLVQILLGSSSWVEVASFPGLSREGEGTFPPPLSKGLGTRLG